MSLLVASRVGRWPLRPMLAASAAALLCAACAQGSSPDALSLAAPSDANSPGSLTTGSVTRQDLAPPAPAPMADMEVSPPVAAAIREARALRTSGKKKEALATLDKAQGADKDPALMGERGLLALELGQVDKAVDLLGRAQTASKPDWRMQSAYGAALSAAGRQKEAQDQFAKALTAAPGQPSILNNLALSYALEGRHDEAEKTLRQASAASGDAQTRQNLALILGLKGKTAEARQITEATLPPDKAKENITFFDTVGRTRVSAADPEAKAPPLQSASIATDKPIMQLGTSD